MANYNRVILAGNLTRDPQLSYTPNNTAVCKFGMAINRRWRDQQGNQQEETCFVDITAFGRSAETLNQYMSKGRSLLVEGRLHFSQWTNQEGQRRSKLEVVADTFQFLGGRGGDRPGAGQSEGAGTPAAAPQQSSDIDPPAADAGSDIPF